MALTRAQPRDRLAETRERFIGDTATHEMEILRDDDLYRHLRFRQPGTVTYGFDLVTWPGHLAIVGDCGDFLFARTRDMLEFFEPSGARGGFEDERWGINPAYWSEKLTAPRPDGAKQFSPEQFQAHVAEWLDEATEELDAAEASALREAIRHQIAPSGVTSEQEAHALLAAFEHDGQRIYDSWEWDLRGYDFRFLWCCWAIVWGIAKYRAAKREEEVRVNFVHG